MKTESVCKTPGMVSGIDSVSSHLFLGYVCPPPPPLMGSITSLWGPTPLSGIHPVLHLIPGFRPLSSLTSSFGVFLKLTILASIFVLKHIFGEITP